MASIDPVRLVRALLDADVCFFSGVPDSVLANLCFAIHHHVPRDSHVVAANEGGAIAAAAGYYMATGRTAAVYLQNSGLGNAVNPLASLMSGEVASIPVLLLVGWRGEPGQDDEVEHSLQGRVTLPLLDLLGVPAEVLPDDEAGAFMSIRRLLDRAKQTRAPVAAVIRPGRFAACHTSSSVPDEAEITRERAIAVVAGHLAEDAAIVSTTGKASRELAEVRARACQGHDRDFLMVGSMGHASQIALGLALGRPRQAVVCLDGDGAAVMHLGSLAVIGSSGAGNLTHIVLNNGAHDSVGGHPTAATGRSFADIARACGYPWTRAVRDERNLHAAMDDVGRARGPALLEVRVRRGARADLGRPPCNPAENVTAIRARLSGRSVSR
jgi:phosphonopyruvate decarboxylase